MPVFGTCSIRQNITTDPEQPTAVATWTNPTATDNTGGIPHVSCYPESGTAFPIGVNNVTCYAVSTNGLVATCDFDVIVTGMCKNDECFGLGTHLSAQYTHSALQSKNAVCIFQIT